jgi:hypothetical protein
MHTFKRSILYMMCADPPKYSLYVRMYTYVYVCMYAHTILLHTCLCMYTFKRAIFIYDVCWSAKMQPTCTHKYVCVYVYVYLHYHCLVFQNIARTHTKAYICIHASICKSTVRLFLKMPAALPDFVCLSEHVSVRACVCPSTYACVC